MSRIIVAALLLGVSGCARPHLPVAMRSPNPNGCYVMFYDRPAFGGLGDLLNGPGRWPALDKIRETNYPNWKNRIRSLRTGAGARVTAYVDSRFRGRSENFSPEDSRPYLISEMSAKIESLQITCQ